VIDTALKNTALREHGVLRHFPALLHRWHGQRAVLLELTTSHRSIRIRVSDSPDGSYLTIACLGPLSMSGPLQFENFHLGARLRDDGIYMVYDSENDFSLLCEHAEVSEHK
jgi:hypothetical protein